MKKFLYLILFFILSNCLYAFSNLKIKMYPESCIYSNSLPTELSDEYKIFEVRNDKIYIYSESESEPLSDEDFEDIYEDDALAIIKFEKNMKLFSIYSVENASKRIGFIYSDKPGELYFIISSEEIAERMVYTFNTVNKQFISYYRYVAGVTMESITRDFKNNTYENRQYEYPYITNPEALGFSIPGYRFNSVILDGDLKYLDYRTDYMNKQFKHFEYDKNGKAERIICQYYSLQTDKETDKPIYRETKSIIKRVPKTAEKGFEYVAGEMEYFYYDLDMNPLK